MDCQIKIHQLNLYACTPMAVRIQIAKLKLCQYQWRAISPNLTLTTIRYIIMSIMLLVFRQLSIYD